MSRSRPAAVLSAVLLLSACGSAGRGAAAPSVDPTAAQLQQQLDDLPTVDGATRTRHDLRGDTLTEQFTVPAGTPACLQVLARLDAGGYEVVAAGVRISPTTCRTVSGSDVASERAGAATVLARGGSEIALTWTATSYAVTATAG